MRPNLFFDLDGTLTDPKPGIEACLRYAMAQMNRPLPPDADLDWCIGPPLHESLERLLPDLSAIEVGRALELYRERYQASGLFENAVYPGIPEALTELARHADLYVATSKPAVFAERIVEHFGLAGHFCMVYGSELDGTRSDKRTLIAHVLEREGLTAPSCWMIGDRAQDMAGAVANAVRPVGVTWGYGSHVELLVAGAGHLLEHPSQLAGLLDA